MQQQKNKKELFIYFLKISDKTHESCV